MTMIDPPVAMASLSGRSDARWARAGAEHVGAAFLGGVGLDAEAQAAARGAVARGREEFLTDDPLRFIDAQLGRVDDASVCAGVNVRATTPGPIRAAAAICARHGAILEVNAHCRQPEATAVGCGEALLADAERLCEQVAAAAGAGATVSVKLRTEVDGVDLPGLAGALESAGADLLHVDAMDSRAVVGDVAEATSCAVIANNGVRDRRDVEEYLALGADGISVGRPSTRPAALERIAAATDAEAIRL